MLYNSGENLFADYIPRVAVILTYRAYQYCKSILVLMVWQRQI